MESCSTLAEEFATLMVTPYVVFLELFLDSIVCFVNVLVTVAKLAQEFILYAHEPAELEFGEFFEFSGAVGKLFREFLFSNPTSAEMREWCLFLAFLSVPLSYLLFRRYFYPPAPDVQEEAREEVEPLTPPSQPRLRRQIMPRVPALSTDRLDVFYFARARHRDAGARVAAAA